MEQLLEMLESFNIVEVICIVILTILALKNVFLDVKKLKKARKTELEDYHEEKTEEESVYNKIDELENTNLKQNEKIDKIAEEVGCLIKTVNTLNEDFTMHRISFMRNKILDFMPRAVDMTKTQSKEKYNEIFKLHDEYHNIIKNAGLENGFETYNYEMIKKSFAERTEKGLFTEDIAKGGN